MPDVPPTRRWPLLLLAIALLLAGCAPGPRAIGEVRNFPTLGPVADRGKIKEKLDYTWSASTNCVSVGEPVTFTMTIINPSTVPITISTTPMIDFIIRPVIWPTDLNDSMPIRRWSEAPDYPTIDPVIPAQQQRSFQWSWVAEPVFVAPEQMGIRVQFYTGAFQLDKDAMPPGGSEIFIGIDHLPSPEGGYSGPSCDQMRTNS